MPRHNHWFADTADDLAEDCLGGVDLSSGRERYPLKTESRGKNGRGGLRLATAAVAEHKVIGLNYQR